MKPADHTQFGRDGFVIVGDVLSDNEVERLREAADSEPLPRANVRNVFAVHGVLREFVHTSDIIRRAHDFFENPPILTRAILFDKKPGANWAVGWHQDVTIAVKSKLDLPGFSAWSIKEGVTHVQPPAEILERMVTIRVHIDDCLEDNGPLQVLPGSHRHGRLSDEEIVKWSNCPGVTCPMPRGGALAMRPLLLHRSSPAKAPSHRRVLHLEFAGETLPGGLEWNVA